MYISRLIESTAKAAKLRPLSDLGKKRIMKMDKELQEAQCNHMARPFGRWHHQSFVHILCSNERNLKAHSMTTRTVRRQEDTSFSFQKTAREQIDKRQKFDAKNRVRQKIARWSIPGPPAIVATRCVRMLKELRKDLSPAVIAGFFRASWNGWPTTARMRSMPDAPPTAHCLFRCSHTAEDRIEHYAHCPVVRQVLATPLPSGPGLQRHPSSIENFFALARGMAKVERARAATAVYAVGKALVHKSHEDIEEESHDVQDTRTSRKIPSTKLINACSKPI